jgi:molecular chaperone DnaK
MVREAESHADEDRRKKDEIEARNRADSTVYQVEKSLKENRDKVPESEAKAVESALEDARKAIESNDAERMKKATEELEKTSHKLFEAMYKNAGPQGGGPSTDGAGAGPGPHAGAEGGNSSAEGEVIDAEYVDADDKKKS